MSSIAAFKLHYCLHIFKCHDVSLSRKVWRQLYSVEMRELMTYDVTDVKCDHSYLYEHAQKKIWEKEVKTIFAAQQQLMRDHF